MTWKWLVLVLALFLAGHHLGCAKELKSGDSDVVPDNNDDFDDHDPWPEPDPIAWYDQQFLLNLVIVPIIINSETPVFVIREDGETFALQRRADGALVAEIPARPDEILRFAFPLPIENKGDEAIGISATDFRAPGELCDEGKAKYRMAIPCKNTCSFNLLVPAAISDNASISLFIGE